MANYAAMTGWGMAVPERVLTNADLERIVETSDEWIQTRTGIRERRVAGPGEYTSTLSIAAGRAALERAGLDAAQIDTVILATCTPDRPFPARNVLFVACDIFTHFINWNDRNTCVLFGDGAGAVVLQPSDEPAGLISCVLGADGEQEDLMAVDAGGTRLPATPELLEQGRQYVYMNGREIFKHAVREMAASSLEAIRVAGLSPDDIALVVPHQANLRIIEATARRLEVPMERVFVNLDRYGNTSAASVPIALVEAVEQQRLRKGDYALLTAFGGGLTWASAVIRWTA